MGTTTAISARSLQYYVIARRWASDLEFFKIETAFLHHLMDDYFVRLCDKSCFEEFKHTGKELLKLEAESSQAEVLLARQLKHVELMAEDIIPENAEELAVNQVHLEYIMTNINRDYRDVKKAMFSLVEYVLKKNKFITGLHAN
ncbi:MAG TPA: hypothetical protein VIM16_09475 [Mucilaginibacter sp.]|jgi:hypothetical protein